MKLVKFPSVRALRAILGESLTKEDDKERTSLEKLVDDTARELGIWFDAWQYYIPLTYAGQFTLVDRVILNPPTAIFIDGIQHDLREDIAHRDKLITMELQSMGWIVIRLHWRALKEDRRATVRKIWYGG